MDGKRYKKIKKYIVVYIAFSLLFSLCMYMQARFEKTEEQRRALTLLENHPEWEAEIVALWYKSGETVSEDNLAGALRLIEEKYGHDVHCIFPEKNFTLFWAAGMLVGAVLTALLGYWENRRRNPEPDETDQELYECLEQFRRGNFRQIPEYEDISETRMKLWETVRELGVYFDGLKKRLEEEEDSTKALITDISHQLKTPLASLRMSHELVTGAHVTEEEKQEFQEQEAREIEKLEMLLAELVNLSRLEKRVIRIDPRPASFKGTIADAVSRIYMKARKKDIEIQVEMEQDLKISHDGKWTTEALVNILDNAVKYSDEHTVITVRVQPLVKNVLIEIEDEGIGIHAEDLPKIYQRFYRGNEAREKVKEGAGVGLYLSRMILERQGGTITAKRRMELGTVFQVTLPY
ncbi:MAG: HAMP domain-containing histidine kinase [Blautia sp.]|nr:HAMP domain-containing histidine kinase [Blautia sp.]